MDTFRRLPASLFFFVFLGQRPALVWAQNVATIDDSVVARVIVKFRADSSLLGRSGVAATTAPSARAAALGSRLALPMSAGLAVSDRSQVVFAAGLTSAELAERLAQQSDVEYAVPDERRRIVVAPRDPLYAAGVAGNGPAIGQWYLRAPTGEVQSSLNIEEAWAATIGSPEIVVAVVDTGVRFEHPDLLPVAAGGHLLPGYDMVSDTATANDGDGRDADASDPGDWVTRTDVSQPGSSLFRCATSPENSSWHGTQLAGLIAALTDNDIGMAGAAPGVRVLPVRVIGKCGGYDSDIIAGMRWAAGLSVPGTPANPSPARVLNLSLGGDGACSTAYQQAVDEITARGSVIVAAAGNSGHAVSQPANCAGVIAVAGLRHAGTKVGFSSLGPEVSISAPGGNCVNTDSGTPCLYPMLTTTDSGQTGPVSSTYTDSYNVSVGTSFSSPLVAAVAALTLSVRPAITPQQVKELLQATARPFPPVASISSSSQAPQCTPPQYSLGGRSVAQQECYCTTTTCGAGMLDAGAAVQLAASRATASTRGGVGPW
ncbi:MAG TPA: S8 family peptidase [Vicinamibacterales bacterium]|nr:S8 family peptidase [Vicinamibacterales bacterium]